MTILFLDQYSDLGGAQRCLLDLLPAIPGRGWRAVVMAPGRGPLHEKAAAAGAEVETISCGPYASGRKGARDAVQLLADLPRQIAAIRRAGADLVYVNGPRLLPAAAFAGGPVLFHCHSRLSGLQARLASRALRHADATMAASCRFVAEPLLSAVPPARFRVVYNGVADCSGPRRLTRDTLRVGLIGRIAPEKGQLEFLRAARLLPGCRFVICGAPLFGDSRAGRYFEELKRAASGLPVEFTGWVEDLREALAGIDVLAVPSPGDEGTTRVIPEAFSAGVPVIAFRTGGIPEIVDNGRTGYLVEPSAEALAGRLKLLLRAPEELADVAAAARAAWAANHTAEIYRNRMLALLEAFEQKPEGQGRRDRQGG